MVRKTTILMVIEITTTLYFFLFLFRFLYAIFPLTPNKAATHFGVRIFFAVNLISLFALNATIGAVLDARIAGFMADFEKAFDFAKELGLSDEAALEILDRI